MNPLLQKLVTYFDIHSGPSITADSAECASVEPAYIEQPLNFGPNVPRFNQGLLNAGDDFVDEMAGHTSGSHKGPPGPPSEPPKKNYSFFQWLALFTGVAIQPFFSHYRSNQTFWGAVPHPWQSLVFAIVVAAILFPGIYRRTFAGDSPVWLQMIPIFTAGIGCNTLLDTAIKSL